MIARLQEEPIDFGCAAPDLFCLNEQSNARSMHDFMTWLAENTIANQELSPGSELYEGAVGASGLGLWMGYALVVMVITATVGLAVAAVKQDTQAIKRTLIGTVLSIPATYAAIWATGKALTVVDQVSAGLLDRLGGSEGTANLLELILPRTAFDLSGVAGPLASNRMLVMGIMLGYIIAMLMGMAALAFRNVILMVLIAFAPLAFVLLPAKGGSVWVKRWLGALVAMVLTKPLIFGMLLLLTGTSGSIDSLWSAGGLTVAIGMMIVSFMPLMAFGFFGFLAKGASSAGDSLGTQGAQKAAGIGSRVTNMTQQVIRRQGGAKVASVAGAAAPVVGAVTVAGSAASGAAGAAQEAANVVRAGAGAGAQPTWSGRGGTATPAAPVKPGGVFPGKGGGSA